tara:strand:+ start:386 stop:652 length:267 start_codon:yes stop_codon:yes gene_type:complete
VQVLKLQDQVDQEVVEVEERLELMGHQELQELVVKETQAVTEQEQPNNLAVEAVEHLLQVMIVQEQQEVMEEMDFQYVQLIQAHLLQQ